MDKILNPPTVHRMTLNNNMTCTTCKIEHTARYKKSFISVLLSIDLFLYDVFEISLRYFDDLSTYRPNIWSTRRKYKSIQP